MSAHSDQERDLLARACLEVADWLHRAAVEGVVLSTERVHRLGRLFGSENVALALRTHQQMEQETDVAVATYSAIYRAKGRSL